MSSYQHYLITKTDISRLLSTRTLTLNIAHTSPTLCKLHWLPNYCFHTLLLTFKALHVYAPRLPDWTITSFYSHPCVAVIWLQLWNSLPFSKSPPSTQNSSLHSQCEPHFSPHFVNPSMIILLSYTLRIVIILFLICQPVDWSKANTLVWNTGVNQCLCAAHSSLKQIRSTF